MSNAISSGLNEHPAGGHASMSGWPFDTPATESSRVRDFRKAQADAIAASESLFLREPVSLEGIQRHLEESRGRRLIIREMNRIDGGAICGLWFRLDGMDVIFHAASATGVHREQVILHELSHILLDHECAEFRAGQYRDFFPDLDHDAVVLALQRSGAGSVPEMTAEILADLLAERIRVSRLSSNPLRGFDAVFG